MNVSGRFCEIYTFGVKKTTSSNSFLFDENLVTKKILLNDFQLYNA